MTAVLHPAPPHRPATTAHRAEPSPSWFRTRRTGLALAILLAATAVLYLWDLTASGYANTFYAAAAQAGSQNWKAWFFGSLDTSNFITVDKPPASLWVMGLSGRIFGFSSASLLVPQAMMGVGSVALVYAAFKRVASPAAGLVAGAVLTATPAAALMFKFDNPDALLVLLMTLAGYFVVRAMSTAAGRRAAMWTALAGVALGFAFLTKMLQGLMVLPAFGVAYVIAGQTRLRTRLVHLVIGAAAVIVSAGWWVLAVWLWPADSRPYIGGSTNNSVMDLVLGYNGLGRLFGNTGGGMNGGGAGSSFGGSTGLDRLFGSEMGIQISWLIPAALDARWRALGAAGVTLERPLGSLVPDDYGQGGACERIVVSTADGRGDVEIAIGTAVPEPGETLTMPDATVVTRLVDPDGSGDDTVRVVHPSGETVVVTQFVKSAASTTAPPLAIEQLEFIATTPGLMLSAQ